MNEHNYILTKDGQLCHYGVLGMKWGVRKNPSKAYVKATRKKQRLDKRVSVRNSVLEVAKRDREETKSALGNSMRDMKVKKAKMELAAEDYNNKRDKFLADAGKTDPFNIRGKALKKSEQTYNQSVGDYNDAARKTNKLIIELDASSDNVKFLEQRAKSALVKSERWQRQMDNAFKNVSLEHIEAGKAILDRKKRK